MSHTSTYKHMISNIPLFINIAAQRGYAVKTEGVVQLYGSNRVDALASIQVEGWRYPIAITHKGEIQYDHFGSVPGSMENLHSLMQEYNEQAILLELPMDLIDSYDVTELENGNKEITLLYGT